jgi:hypothetical protein
MAEPLDDLLLYDHDRVPIPFGVPNTGGTCWFAATLQFLASFPAALRWLEIARDATRKDPPQTTRELQATALREQTFRAISQYTPQHASEQIPPLRFHPGALMRQLALVSEYQGHRLFSGPLANQDAAEGFRIFVEALCDSLPRDTPELFAYLNHDEEMWVVCLRCKAKTAPQITTGLHMEVEQPHGDFATRIHRQKSRVDDWSCGKCSRKVSGVHFRVLRTIREGFIFISNKYQRTPTEFPLEFTLRLKGSKKSARYRRIASVEHIGGFDARTGGGGHYFAVCDRLADTAKVRPSILDDASIRVAHPPGKISGSYMVGYHLIAVE